MTDTIGIELLDHYVTPSSLYRDETDGSVLKVASLLGICCDHDVMLLDADQNPEVYTFLYIVRPNSGSMQGLSKWASTEQVVLTWRGDYMACMKAAIKHATTAMLTEVENESA